MDGKYDCQYWERLERNWRKWKDVKPAREEKGRLTVVCGVVEEERGKTKEWMKEDEMGQMGDASNEL